MLSILLIFIRPDLETSQPRTNQLKMDRQTVIRIRQQQVDIELLCDKVDRNLFKLLKLIYDAGMLYPHFPPPKKIEYVEEKVYLKKITSIRKKLIKEEVDLESRHKLNNVRASEIIWKSGCITKELGVMQEQWRRLYKDRLVGKNNKLDEIISTLQAKIKKAEEQDPSSNQLILTKKKMKRMYQLKKQISKFWLRTKYQPPSELKVVLGPPLSLFEGMPEEKKNIVISRIKKCLLKIDLQLLRESVMFIQEVESGHCIVTLEQSYPCFMVFKELFKKTVDQTIYNKGLRQLMLAKEECYKRGMMFRTDRFLMCHLCGSINFKEDKDGFHCLRIQKKQSLSDWPHGYQRINLMSDYSYVKQYENKKKQIDKLHEQAKKFLNRKFQTYKHPYSQVHNKICNRYYCSNCRPKNQQKQSQVINLDKETRQVHNPYIAQKPKKIETCFFCKLSCVCERCTSINNFNRLMAIHQSIGGNFDSVLNNLLFLNLESSELFIQYVTFDEENDICDIEGPSQGVFLTEEEINTLTLPEQIVRLQAKMKMNGFMMEQQESVDSNQIFPQVQKMFNDLLMQQSDLPSKTVT